MKLSIKIITIIFAIASIVMLLFYPIFLLPFGDDLLYIFQLKSQNILPFCLTMATEIDARIFSPLAILNTSLYKYFSHTTSLYFFTISFLANCYIIYFKLLQLKINDFKTNILFSIFFVFIFFNGLNIVTSEVIYWHAGGYYMLCLTVGLLYIHAILKKSYNTSRYIVYFYLLSILVGTLTYNLTIPLLFFAMINLRKNKNISIHLLLSIIIISLILIIYVFSPGALARTNLNYPLDKKVLIAYFAIIHVLRQYLLLSLNLVLFTLFFSFLVVITKTSKRSIRPDYGLADKFQYLIMAIFSVLPFVVAPGLAANRTALYFMTFLLIFVFLFSKDIFTVLFGEKNIHENYIYLIMFIYFMVHIVEFSDHFYMAYDIRKQFSERQKTIHEAQQKGLKKLVLKPYNFEKFVPYTLYAMKEFDLTTDMNSWQNIEYKAIYNIDTIIVSTK